MQRYYFGYYQGHFDSFPDDWLEDFEYRVEVDDNYETVRIRDTCGRYVPINYEDLNKLIRTLKVVERKIFPRSDDDET